MNKIEKVNEVLNELRDPYLFEMSNLDTDDTGLSNGIIYISTKYAYGTQIPHSARIKYTNDNNTMFKVSVTISDNPEIVVGEKDSIPSKNLKELYKWIKINKIKLLDYWENGNTYITKKFLNSLEKI